MKTALCTIIAKNYLAHARLLMASVRKYHPEFLRVVILADTVDGYFDPAREDFTLIPSAEVPAPNPQWFHFKYNILELSTGIKPYSLEMLLDQHGLDRIIYLDPDVKVYRPLDPVVQALGNSDITLTPHLMEPITDSRRPSELDILRAGSYNLGFIAVNNNHNVRSFLHWWQKNTQDHCVVDVERGLFVDQKWIDLVPGLFDNVSILREPGLNVAYWNVHGRKIERGDEAFRVNGRPLYFFHFSGFNPDAPEQFSKHQDRFRTRDLGDAALLVEGYRRELVERGWDECKNWPYAYDSFADGTPIPPVARAVLNERPILATTIEDPFSAAGIQAFTETWNQRILGPDGGRSLTRLAYRIYKLRLDLQAVMPDVFGAHWRRYLWWLTESGAREYNLSASLVTPVRQALANLGREASPATASLGEVSSGPPSISGGAQATEVSAGPELSQEVLPTGSTSQFTTLSQAIYDSRSDLRTAFPDPCGRDSLSYLTWMLSYGRWEYRLDALSLHPVRQEWTRILSNVPKLRSWWYRTRLAAYSMSARLSGHRGNGFQSMLHEPGPVSTLAGPAAPTTIEPEQVLSPQLPAKRPRPSNLGINAVGYVTAEMGVGEVVRMTIRAARSAGLGTAVKSVSTKGVYREKDRRFRGDEDEYPAFPVNVIHVNADQAPIILPTLGEDLFRERYNIGYWCWEVEEFPSRFAPSFEYFHEIWTLSSFSQDSIARKSPIPVVRIPPAIDVGEPPRRSRADFGLPEDSFLFVTAFDMLSVFERKNPLGVIRAFAEAFRGDTGAHLVIKISNAKQNPSAMQSLVDACANCPVTIIDRVIDRADVYALFQACDCLISLHRSEGFGLALAEAMHLGKPVVATGYSGNMDFTTVANSFLVGYRLTPVPEGCDPYPTTARWADPSIAHAVAQLRVVKDSADRREELARAGQADVRDLLSPQAVGRSIRKRLECLAI